MIRVTISDPKVLLEMLPAVYTNRLMNVASPGQRRRVNEAKQAFIDAVARREPHVWRPAGDVWRCARCPAEDKRRKPKDDTCCPRGAVLELGCVVEGAPVEGPAVVVYRVRLARCDWDASIKAVQDATQGLVFAGGDDKAVAAALVVLSRPDAGSKPHKDGTRKREPVLPEVVVEARSVDDPFALPAIVEALAAGGVAVGGLRVWRGVAGTTGSVVDGSAGGYTP